MLVQYQCGLRGQQISANLPFGKNQLKDLKRIISQDIRVQSHLISISCNNQILTNENEQINSNELYYANVIPNLKQYNFQISSEGGQFFECTLEEQDLVQDLIDQIDLFLAQIIKENYDSYELYQIAVDQQTKTQIKLKGLKGQVIREVFKETNLSLKIQLVHEILTLILLENENNTREITINRFKTLLDLKKEIGQSQSNLAVVINGKHKAQNFDNRLIKDVFQHQDTIYIVQVQDFNI